MVEIKITAHSRANRIDVLIFRPGRMTKTYYHWGKGMRGMRKISAASVRRAQRAQLALLNR